MEQALTQSLQVVASQRKQQNRGAKQQYGQRQMGGSQQVCARAAASAYAQTMDKRLTWRAGAAHACSGL